MSKFRFRRITPRGDGFAEVELIVEISANGFQFASEVPDDYFSDELFMACIEKGVLAAINELGVEPSKLLVRLVSAKALTSETPPAYFQVCAAGAIFKHFGRLDLAPNPGWVNET